jgi:glucose/arabinose dehydrogenase
MNLKRCSILILLAGLLLALAACSDNKPTQPPIPTIVTGEPTAALDLPTVVPSPVVPTATPLPPATNTSVPPPPDTPTPQPPTATPPSSSNIILPTDTPTLTPIPTDTPPPIGAIKLDLVTVGGGFNKPVYITHAGDGSGRIFVVEQAGRILSVKDNITTLFLDITNLVGSDANEQGLLSVAFHPDYATNGLFFVNYTNKDGDTVIARYQGDSSSGKVLLTIPQPFANHNGGQIAFGPDGYLYVGMGDGGSAGDPQNNAQNLGSLLGKILRLDVDNATPYGAPASNPFVGVEGARPEIWSYGWRNPWRFSFDRATGDLYVADVGQNAYEEIDIEFAGTPGGKNYGWRLMEGQHCFNPEDCDPTGLVLPIREYGRAEGCSVTGGYVYRGQAYPEMHGIYLYGDYCTGTVWGIRREADGNRVFVQMLQTGHNISSFGEDEAGEIYLANHKGAVYRCINRP